jgi:hypothetical protein
VLKVAPERCSHPMAAAALAAAEQMSQDIGSATSASVSYTILLYVRYINAAGDGARL